MNLRTISLSFLAFLCATPAPSWLFAQTPPDSTPLPVSESDAAPSNPQERKDRASHIESLITQLGSQQFAERDAARRELAEIGGMARSALQEAVKNHPNLEVVARARRLLALLPEATHTVVDAFGQAIPRATVTVKIVQSEGMSPGVEQVISGGSDDEGRIAIPDIDPREQRAVVELMHSDYGRGRFEVTTFTGKKPLRFPLVKKGTEARARAVSGIVVDDSGKPVAGALVRSESARTPGEGLVASNGTHGDGMTDEQGRFVFYLPNKDLRGERGELIPVNTKYDLSISVAGDQSYFPHIGSHSNLQTDTITLRRATRFHQFRFQAIDGGWIEDPELMGYLHVRYEGEPPFDQRPIPLEHDVVRAGRLLVPGRYRAGYFKGSEFKYLPVEVTADSPKVLEFKLPPPKVYRGRVINGVTGQPLAGAMVMGYYSIGRNNLALLTPEKWRELREIAERGDFNPRDEKHEAIMRHYYGVQALVRSGEDGRFEMTQAADGEFYGLVAMEENYVPFKVGIQSLKTNVDGPIEAGEFFLFPAAKVMVRPVFKEEEQHSISPKWLVEPNDQPNWFGRFQAASDGQNREFEYVHWLQINEPQPLLIPAGVRLRMMFECPYNDARVPAVIKEPIQLAPGQTFEIGEVHFAAALPAVVRLVDQANRPLEGIPVRRRYSDGNGSVAHNTDAAGEAKFYVNPNSKGRFYIYDITGDRNAANLAAPFKVADEAPDKPFVISLTDEQRRLILETPPRVP